MTAPPSAEWTLDKLRELLLVARDGASGALTTIDFPHHEIHEGESFTCHYDNTVTNINEMTVIAFNTPDSAKRLHLVVDASVTAPAVFILVEAPSIDPDEGTDLAIYNRERNSAKTSDVSTIEAVPEVGEATSYNEAQAAGANISTTTQLTRKLIGSGSGPFSTGGGAELRDEFLLAPNTQYAFILQALTNDDNVHNIVLSWYERVSNA